MGRRSRKLKCAGIILAIILTALFLFNFCYAIFVPIFVFGVQRTPMQKKFDLDEQTINDIKVWEMKNLDGRNRRRPTIFFMIDKEPDDKEEIIRLCNDLYETKKDYIVGYFSNFKIENGCFIEIYKKTKFLPKYYIEKIPKDKWDSRDIIDDHIYELTAVVKLDSSFKINGIQIKPYGDGR